MYPTSNFMTIRPVGAE